MFLRSRILSIMKNLTLLTTLAVFLLTPAMAGTQASFEGDWSAPSLSQPNTPLLFSLRPDGKADERVGAYRGVGTWKVEEGAARITWASGWIGLLRPATAGGFELLTWKKGSLPNGPPDHMVPARRVEP